jgi:hypothetical protein
MPITAGGNILTFPFPKAEASLDFKAKQTYYLRFETDLIDLSSVMSRWQNGFYLVEPEYGFNAISNLNRRK